MLRIQPSKLGVALSVYSAALGQTQGEARNYDALFWDPNNSPKNIESRLERMAGRYSHELYYNHLINPDALNAFSCFANPVKTELKINHIKRGITGKPSGIIVDALNKPSTYNSDKNFWSLTDARIELEEIEGLIQHIDEGTVKEAPGEDTRRIMTPYRRRLKSIIDSVSGLHKLFCYLPPDALPYNVKYTDLYLNKYYGYPGTHIGNNAVFIVGEDGTLIYSFQYRDNSKKPVDDKLGVYLQRTGYVIITPKADICVILSESKVRYFRILELDLKLPKLVASVMLWSILYTFLEEDGSIFDFVSGLMEKQVDSIMTESLIMGARAHPADLEHEEDGSITDLVSSIARNVKLVTYPVEMKGLRSK